MPITGQYSWRDSVDCVKVLIPVKGVSPSNFDIQVTSTNLKVNYSPYLIDVILRHPIDPINHKAKIVDGTLHITLRKKTAQSWENLLSPSIIDSDCRQVIETERLLLQSSLQETKKSKKIEDERFALRQQMAIDEAERSKLDDLKREEKRVAEASVYKTFAEIKVSENKIDALNKDTSSVKTMELAPAAYSSFCKSPLLENNIGGLNPTKSTETVTSQCVELHHHDANLEAQALPPPRNSQKPSISPLGGEPSITSKTNKVEIKFTQRLFPTPLRESKVAQEQDWISKNRKHIKSHAIFGKNSADITEDDPTWLKAKADDFCRHGDFQSAISAYSSTLDLLSCDGSLDSVDDKSLLLSCYANRAMCHFQLQSYRLCRTDCQRVVSIFDNDLERYHLNVGNRFPDCEYALSPIMVKLFITTNLRWSLSACHLGEYSEASDCHKTCLQILNHDTLGHTTDASIFPWNLYLVDDAKTMLSASFNLPSMTHESEILLLITSADALKKRGDQMLTNKDAYNVQEACKHYDRALQIFPLLVNAYANRAICHLSEKNCRESIMDCTTALYLLKYEHCDVQTDVLTKSGPNPIFDPSDYDQRIERMFNQPSNTMKNHDTDIQSHLLLQSVLLPLLSAAGEGFNSNSGYTPSMLVNIVSTVIPTKVHFTYKPIVLKTLCRRGASFLTAKEYRAAELDYRHALEIDPKNEQLVLDYKHVKDIVDREINFQV